jgi:hypothetical protein
MPPTKEEKDGVSKRGKLISLKKINLRTLNRSFIVMTQEVLK